MGFGAWGQGFRPDPLGLIELINLLTLDITVFLDTVFVEGGIADQDVVGLMNDKRPVDATVSHVYQGGGVLDSRSLEFGQREQTQDVVLVRVPFFGLTLNRSERYEEFTLGLDRGHGSGSGWRGWLGHVSIIRPTAWFTRGILKKTRLSGGKPP
jgi:hypothetical protein